MAIERRYGTLWVHFRALKRGVDPLMPGKRQPGWLFDEVWLGPFNTMQQAQQLEKLLMTGEPGHGPVQKRIVPLGRPPEDHVQFAGAKRLAMKEGGPEAYA